MHKFHSSLSLLRWCELVNTMAKIEDMAFGIFCIVKNPSDTFLELILWQQQGEWVKISLNGNVAKAFYGIANIDTPVKSKNIGS